MSSTKFKTEGSFSGRGSTYSYGTFYVHHYKQSYSEACKLYYTITVNTTIFLKKNPRFRNM